MKPIKLIYKVMRVMLPIILLLALTNCEKEVTPDDDPISDLEKAQQEVEAKLSATWNLSRFSRDNLDATAEFTNFILSIGKQTYTSQNGLHIWPSTGIWQFVEGKSTQVVRDDGVIIDVEVDETSLSLSFKFDENIFTTGGKRQTVSSSLVLVLNN